MIFVIEVGNTNIVLGVYKEGSLIAQWRIHTDLNKTDDQYLVEILSLLQFAKIDQESISRTVLASVVSPLIPIFEKTVQALTGKVCYVVDWTSFPEMLIRTSKAEEVGVDRLLNAFAAYELFRCSLIIIDCGTATTFEVVSESGEFLGGAIAPGMVSSLDALISKTNKLPNIELKQPPGVIGRNTIHSMQSGVLYGYAGMVDAMITMMCKELGYMVKTIATGGLAKVIQPLSSKIDEVIEDLTLKGLYFIAKKIDKINGGF